MTGLNQLLSDPGTVLHVAHHVLASYTKEPTAKHHNPARVEVGNNIAALANDFRRKGIKTVATDLKSDEDLFDETIDSRINKISDNGGYGDYGRLETASAFSDAYSTKKIIAENDVKAVILSGFNTCSCIYESVVEHAHLIPEGVQLVIPADCVANSTFGHARELSVEAALAEMEAAGAIVTTSDEIRAAMKMSLDRERPAQPDYDAGKGHDLTGGRALQSFEM